MTTPDWQLEARRLIDRGVTLAAAARAVGKPQTTLRVALDINGAKAKQLACQRAHRRRERQALAGARIDVEAAKPSRNDQRVVERAYAEAPAKRPLTLPKISIQAQPPDLPVARKFAPRTRLEPKGVDRWRFHHLKMIREGRIPAPGLPEQLHH